MQKKIFPGKNCAPPARPPRHQPAAGAARAGEKSAAAPASSHGQTRAGLGLLCLLLSCRLAAADAWRGVHLWLDNDTDAQTLVRTLPALAAAGANTLVLEINYSFEFQSHPELRNSHFVTRDTARALARAAKKSGLRLIPEFNCLGHQTFGGERSPLLQRHPEFNETPARAFPSPHLYCLEWCPSAPGLNAVVFSLLDELIAAFKADALHVGMDEVYLVGADECPRCRGQSPAALYAAQVNALHDHLVGRRHRQMLMWADRLVGPQYQGVCQYDNPSNNLSAAIGLIPKDIVLCDWHYEGRKAYPSLAYLEGKGFKVWPAGFEPLAASRAFSDFARGDQSGRVLGFLATTWNETTIADAPQWPPIKELLPAWRKPGR